MENKILEWALWYEKKGFSVIPIQKNKKPYLQWEKFQTKKADQDLIRQLWQKWPAANIGIVTGALSGIMVVDVDSQAGMDELEKFLPDNLITPVAETPGGGWHYYFRYRKGLVNRARVITDCDIRTDGGYIIAPPSVGENGKGYSWMSGLSISDIPPAAMPDALYNIQTNRASGIAGPVEKKN